MFTIIANAINNMLTWAERKIAFYQGYTLIDKINIKFNAIEWNYIINGEDII